MSGHGHVTPNADGRVAKCGGPGLCEVCQREQDDVSAKSQDAKYEAVSLVLERADHYSAAFAHGVQSGQTMAGAWSDLVREVCALAGIDAVEWAKRSGARAYVKQEAGES